MNKPLKLDYLWAGLCLVGCGILCVPVPGNPMKTEDSAEPLTVIHQQVNAAREGRDPRVIARLFTGWAVFGERQFVRGYALLLPDPVVPNLNALGARERIAFLSDMSRLGDALLKVTGAARINYAIFGNQDPALHAHVIPRYLDEPEPYRTQHPWAYDWNGGRGLRPRQLPGPGRRGPQGTHAPGGHQAHALQPGRERRAEKKPAGRAGPLVLRAVPERCAYCFGAGAGAAAAAGPP